MRVGIQYCVNCGEKYMFQWSGTSDATPEIPKEYRDSEYCPDCKKAIVDALATIPKKSEVKWVSTDEVDLDTLLTWEKKAEESEKEYESNFPQTLFPKMRRVWASLYHTELNEHTKQNEVINPNNRRKYFYRYFPSLKNEAKITVQVRVRYGTNEIIDYR